jgi:hypothetical protein
LPTACSSHAASPTSRAVRGSFSHQPLAVFLPRTSQASERGGIGGQGSSGEPPSTQHRIDEYTTTTTTASSHASCKSPRLVPLDVASKARSRRRESCPASLQLPKYFDSSSVCIVFRGEPARHSPRPPISGSQRLGARASVAAHPLELALSMRTSSFASVDIAIHPSR